MHRPAVSNMPSVVGSGWAAGSCLFFTWLSCQAAGTLRTCLLYRARQQKGYSWETRCQITQFVCRPLLLVALRTAVLAGLASRKTEP